MKNTLRMSTMLMASLLAMAAQANSPVGRWHTIDDKTGETRSVVTIEDAGGVLRGKVSQILRKGAPPAATCEKCTDDRKDQAILGMEIIRGVKKSSGNEYWEGGEILDPEEGKLYRVRLTPIEGGTKLQVRGFLGPFWRNQLWVKAP
ncbi:hypothetical protein B9Z47_03165 [Limnohabitans sp. 2KL-1]|jgi:uncharacterized protein (DUF2147 family)|uniref:DUF2147 domain-containing protein n=1 Tax=Limnohabitans sp. 2KL-1 TaxID=1100699 RepID=UPI000D379C91|nr:DUF2147 domain-containing protein [Limnohabitans sp. 2KL-1]PUE50752.1 hypothetical protein B9Z47_03165 [Limnohabitans sp. 2KL-1]